MHDTTRFGSQDDHYRALAVIAIGLSHFLWPRVFDPINKLGFPDHTRRYTYINGAIETSIGVLMARPQTRSLSTVVSACYATYLIGNIIRARTAGALA
jgi:hypothetical protein